MDESRSYRIRADVGHENDSAIHVKLTQTFDMFEILSLRLSQTNAYKLYQSDYGVVVGRVYANGGFGVPNARLSIFIEADGNDGADLARLYGYANTSSRNLDGVRYNLLPEFVDDACHQDVGTFPNKRTVLDNGDVIEVFDKYYKYTTTTNNSGDYMIFGVPKGGHTLHMDVDLSDIGILSQRPRDMIYKGYNPNQFESPNKFKSDKNLTSLVQIISQDAGIYIHPFWGDQSDDGEEIAITRFDIELPYKFEPTCVFMGSIFTDTNGIALGKNCTPMYHQGNMSELTSGEGSIEMIRKTYDGRVEEFQVKGNRVIDGDGVWCYQIPMNLDYMITDEFGNMVPTDNPERGIPTRARVRFRVSLDEMPNDMSARKRCRYLIPNNPREDDENPHFNKTHEVDYEFGTNTQEESYRDLFWNNVYTVKNYVPRIQKNLSAKDKRHTGIKLINHHGDNNPMPYNNLNIRLSFQYRFLCILFKFFVQLIIFVNRFLGIAFVPICLIARVFLAIGNTLWKTRHIPFVGWVLAAIGAPFKYIGELFESMIPSCIGIGSDFCGDNVTHNYTFYPGCDISAGVDCIWEKTKKKHAEEEKDLLDKGEITREEMTTATRNTDELYNCIETQLAEDNDITSFEFNNDWINGALYAPMWYRHITKKRSYLFGLIRHRAKDQWCSAENAYNGLPKLFNSCAVERSGSKSIKTVTGQPKTYHYMLNSDNACKCRTGKKKKELCRCHDLAKASVPLDYGLVVSKETILGQTVYYYKPVEYTRGTLKILFCTDIVLLGSLNDCDLNGIPQFFKYLDNTTYNMPPNLLVVDKESSYTMDELGNLIPDYNRESGSEQSGSDWGNSNWDLCGNKEENQTDGGLFYSIGCSSIRTLPKTCINLSRICELGVGADVTVSAPDLTKSNSGRVNYTEIPPDGFISYDEVYGEEFRSMFATLNGNRLRTRINPETSFPVYDFRYINVDAFDNSLGFVMQQRQMSCTNSKYKYNYKLEHLSNGYLEFRMGENPTYYDTDGPKNGYPVYENSFYFYFGLKNGKTAIDKFNSQFYSNCTEPPAPEPQFSVFGQPNSWCKDSWVDGDGYVAFDMSKLEFPIKIHVHGNENGADFQLASIPEKFSKFVFREGNDVETDPNDVLYGFKDVDALSSIITDIEIPDYDSTGNYQIPEDESEDDNIQTFLNGTYTITVEDGNGDIYTTVYKHKPKTMSVDIVPSAFEDEDDALMDSLQTREAIASNDDGVSEQLQSRDIGGTICLNKILGGQDGKTPIKYVHVEITNDDDEVSGIISCAKLELVGTKYNTISGTYNNNLILTDTSTPIFGVPKGNVTYKVAVRELCKDGDVYWETNNLYESGVYVEVPRPMRLLINDVDYGPISGWNVAKDSDITPIPIYGTGDNGDTPVLNLGEISENWFKMSTAEYDWSKLSSIWDNYSLLSDVISTTCGLMLSSGGSINNYQAPRVMGDAEITSFLNILKSEISGYPANKKDYTKDFDEISGWHQDMLEWLNNRTFNDEGQCVGQNASNYISSLYSAYVCDSRETNPTDYEKTEVLKAQIQGILDTITAMSGENGWLGQIMSTQDDYIRGVKNTFRINCENTEMDITVRLDTANVGVVNGDSGNVAYPQYHYGFSDEEAQEDELWNRVKAFKTGATDELTFSGVSIPTVTYPESELYGSNEFYGTYYSKVKNLRQSPNDPPVKWPYFVYGENKRKKTLPKDNNYFGFHLVDKIFTSRYLTWSAVAKFPFYKKVDDCVSGKVNKWINLFGMFAGYIMNGYPKTVDKGTNRVEQELVDGETYDKYPTFTTQTIGDLSVRLLTRYDLSTDDEDTMPVRRVVKGLYRDDDTTIRISGLSEFGLFDWLDDEVRLKYLILSPDTEGIIKWCESPYNLENGDQVTPIPLAPENNTMSFTDSIECHMDDSLYGLLSFDVETDSVFDCHTSANNRLALSVSGLDEDEVVKYRFYRIDDPTKYPLDESKIKESEASITIGTQTTTVQTGIYYLKDNVANEFPFSYNETFTGTHAPQSANTTGVCKNGVLQRSSDFYVYAIAEHGGYGKISRAISPLYCFEQMRIVGALSENVRLDFNDDDEVEVITTGTVQIRFARKNSADDNYGWDASTFCKETPYYLRYYPFDVSISGSTWDDVTSINYTFHFEPDSAGLEAPVVSIGLSETDMKNYKKKKRANRIRIFMEELDVEIVDVTGLTTIPFAKYIGKRKEQKYGYRAVVVNGKFSVSVGNKGGEMDVGEEKWFSKGTAAHVSWDKPSSEIKLKDLFTVKPTGGWEIYFDDDGDARKTTKESNYFDVSRPYDNAVLIIGVYNDTNEE